MAIPSTAADRTGTQRTDTDKGAAEERRRPLGPRARPGIENGHGKHDPQKETQTGHVKLSNSCSVKLLLRRTEATAWEQGPGATHQGGSTSHPGQNQLHTQRRTQRPTSKRAGGPKSRLPKREARA